MPLTPAELADAVQRIERVTMKTAETVGIMDERQKVDHETIREIEAHAREQNGSLLSLATEQHKMEGALAMLRWMVAAATTGIGAGAALAGVILAVVSRG